MLMTILIILLILFLIGAVGSAPVFNHSQEWGYGPSGGISLGAIIVIILLFLLLTGRL